MTDVPAESEFEAELAATRAAITAEDSDDSRL
jgi:hypothetical protein